VVVAKQTDVVSYKVGQMHMAILIQQDIVRFYVSMYDALPVDIPQRTAKLGKPESNSLFGEGFARYVESKVSTSHEVYNEVPVRIVSICPSNLPLSQIFQECNLQVFYILKAIPQIAQERVVEVFEHSAFADYISYTLGSYDCATGRVSTMPTRTEPGYSKRGAGGKETGF
jgi:hypothetical protein